MNIGGLLTTKGNRTDKDKTGHLSCIVPIRADRHGHTSIDVSVVRRYMSANTPQGWLKYNHRYRGGRLSPHLQGRRGNQVGWGCAHASTLNFIWLRKRSRKNFKIFFNCNRREAKLMMNKITIAPILREIEAPICSAGFALACILSQFIDCEA